ncbi:MAG: type II toxin-antitoxin system VapC family toxin [Gemmatimonas sp.]|uniref:type II toxin-antitoxin system VapC family toxin n=1 Tax=Gemmatimonas sp. TaxID=1962908 RepID=UPI0025C2060C|nr:type II toxin-antitoxin system VapC family toxin [Gemmatimonas sp.]MCE2952779.1 type II toxin-antitoxin system VapC family toxin [Gemmatimonas sp.]
MVKRARLNVVDSSAWLAYFADEPTAAVFAPPIEHTEHLVVPAICLTEVFKVVARQRGEGDALQVTAVMQQGQVVALDESLALTAAKLGRQYNLPLADSIVYATAKMVGGVVWTQDDDFTDLPDVLFHPKQRTR